MKPRALITGITGQDGSYLAEFLLKKGYEVHGIVRRVAIENPNHRFWRLKTILNKIHVHSGTMENYASIFKILNKVKPNEFYHLAAQSYVDYSFEDQFSTLSSNISSTHYCLSAIKESGLKTKFYFAGSSEMFGKAKKTPQNEETPFHPRSPYGISKVAGFDLTRNFRESYGIHASTGILFNHESERRGYEFVTRKITQAVSLIKLKKQKYLELGNLEAKRDWGYAPEYIQAMWLMLQQKEPGDYVVGTGKTYSIKYFAENAFDILGLNFQKHIKINKNFFRPSEVDLLVADSSKIKKSIGWKAKTNVNKLIEKMVINDYNLIKKRL
ncbi:GDP-mannose 4,6-dehydratase [Alphaproteobacteria bacterium]|nr:GDP-mannose 4,6-dehydratase [Alphaproteobacteria bacterium]